jgi:hypothetical protein
MKGGIPFPWWPLWPEIEGREIPLWLAAVIVDVNQQIEWRKRVTLTAWRMHAERRSRRKNAPVGRASARWREGDCISRSAHRGKLSQS